MLKALATSKNTALVWSPLVKVSVDPFKKGGHLQRRTVSGLKPKLFVTQQPALFYILEDPNE
jgi:hypothetical protein